MLIYAFSFRYTQVQRRLNFDLYSVKPYRELAEMVSSLKILI